MSRATGIKSTRRTGRVNVTEVTQGGNKGRTPATDYNCGPTTTTGGGLGVHNWSFLVAVVQAKPEDSDKGGGSKAKNCVHGSVPRNEVCNARSNASDHISSNSNEAKGHGEDLAEGVHSALHLGGLALGLGQLGPDAQPRSLAKVLPSQNTTRLGFKAHCLCRIHVLPPRQALIEVLLMNAMRGCQLAANFGFDHSAHVSHHSDSLDGLQAIRYKSLSGDLIEPKTMETSSDRRKRKLAQLCADKGGLRAVADKSGVSWESLDQVLKGTLLPPKKDGSRSPRSLGSAAARAIESAFGLGAGWFDLADEAAPTSQSFASLSAYEAALITVIRNGLSEKELSQLTDAVQGAVKTKRVRESTGSDVGEIGVYFSLDRRSHDVKVDSDQRGVPWEIKHSGQSPPDSKGSKRGAS